jgi:hypothetical protein
LFDVVVVEVKSVEALAPVLEAQLLTYLKLSGRRLGLLTNFNVPMLKQGIKRMIRRSVLTKECPGPCRPALVPPQGGINVI